LLPCTAAAVTPGRAAINIYPNFLSVKPTATWTQVKPSGIFLMDIVNSLKIKKLTGLYFIFALTWASAILAEPVGGTNHLSETIQYLLDFVKTSECIFIRNQKEHTAVEAASHMQRKYEHYKGKIKTPEDFIRLTATKSLMTGKLYYVELKDGKKTTSEAWLLQALEDYRQKQN